MGGNVVLQETRVTDVAHWCASSHLRAIPVPRCVTNLPGSQSHWVNWSGIRIRQSVDGFGTPIPSETPVNSVELIRHRSVTPLALAL